MEIGILIVIIGFVSIAYMFITAELEHRKKHPKGASVRNECCNCKYFQKVQGRSTLGTCLFFFKSFKPWNPACHRWEKKGGFDED